ncbi:Bacterial regulatory protein, tetR family [compost metagenome]
MTKVEEIKRQAISLMAEKSFDGVSLRQLAEAVGIQPGSIYAHYQSKHQLLLELFCDYQEDLLSAWMEQGRCRDPQQALLSFVAVYVQFHLGRASESRIVQLDFRSLDSQGKAVVCSLKAQYEAELEAILSKGISAGVFRLTHAGTARVGILCLLQGICSADCELARGDPSAVFEVCAAATLRLVGASPMSQQVLSARRA